jgi:hypothetical protein
VAHPILKNRPRRLSSLPIRWRCQPRQFAPYIKAAGRSSFFSKWIKQHLRDQALYVLVAIVRKRLNLEAPPYTLLQVFSVAVFEKIEIQTAFSRGGGSSEYAQDDQQLNLFSF